MQGKDRSVGVGDTVIGEVLVELRTIDHRSRWDRTLAIGKLIFVRFFQEDERRWQTRQRNKNESIRRLAAKPDCPYGKSMLTQAVGVYLFCLAHREIEYAEPLTPTHVGSVLGLESQEAVRLLETGRTRAWSAREIAAAATRIRRSQGERRGRPQSQSAQKAETWVRRALAALHNVNESLEQAGPPSDAHRTLLADYYVRLERELAQLRSRLALQPSLVVVKPAPPVARAEPA
ncbi:MAG TPA: hypothetical protein VGK73_18970 [Polyangiaceae bacterium]